MSRTAQGLRAWLVQRFSAVYLAAYLLVAAVCLLTRPLPDYARWRDWFAQPWVGVLTVIFLVAVLLHAWIGVREVLVDYVHPVWLRLVLLALTGLVLLASLLWVLRALTLVALGGAV